MVEARTLVAGEAAGPTLALEEPLSLWGGLDPITGRVVDPRHPQRGVVAAGRVLVMTTGRGSSSSSTILAEAARAGTAPVAIVLREPDAILALGAIVARELYGAAIPVVVVDDDAAFAAISTSPRLRVSGTAPAGTASVEPLTS